MPSPVTYLACVRDHELSLIVFPMVTFASKIRLRIWRYRMVSASAFFFKSLYPFCAPDSRFLMTARTVTVGTTFSRLVVDIAPRRRQTPDATRSDETSRLALFYSRG